MIQQCLCESQSPVEAADMLRGIVGRCGQLGKLVPSVIIVDNCCTVRNHLQAAIPSAVVCNNIFHIIVRYVIRLTVRTMTKSIRCPRYLAVITNGARNPHRLEVAKDISSTLLKSTASTSPEWLAEYRSPDEQEKGLDLAFKKWVPKGVWSPAASKVIRLIISVSGSY